MANGRVPASCPPGFQGRYTVRAGDTMFLIAQRFGVSLNALIAANPHISNPNQLRIGDVLCVPGATTPPGQCRMPASCPPGFQGRYTVQPGDTMFTIAQRFGVSLNALIAANPQIPNPNVLIPCDVLCVPGTTPPPGCRVPTSCPPGFQGRYTVQPGDTMFTIAQRFGVSVNALIAANPQIPNPNVLIPCDVLCVPGTQVFQTPCTAMLDPTMGVITDARGSILVRFLATNQRSASVMAVGVPEPGDLGEFNAYEASISFPPPEGGSVVVILSPTPATSPQPRTWAGTLNFPVGSGWTADTLIVVRPVDINTGGIGNAVLTGTLTDCCN